MTCSVWPRMNVNVGAAPAEEGSWRQSVQFMLDTSVCVLLQPDTTAGVEWEIGEISRRGIINQTIFLMLPLCVDKSARASWRTLSDLLHGTVGDLPDYRPEGAFVFLQSPGDGFGQLPFSALFSGELSRLLVAKCTGKRPAIPPEE
jgi:hypothetical protein